MAGFSALGVRDLIALVIMAARVVGTRDLTPADELTDYGFGVADAFTTRSEGLWAPQVRETHAAAQQSRDRVYSTKTNGHFRDTTTTDTWRTRPPQD